jgi:hypothetical protein
MTDSDDSDEVLHRFITDDRAERLLAGGEATGDDDLASIAGLFTVLRAPAQPAELAETDDLVARMAAAVRDGRTESVQEPSRRRPVLARVITAKVAALATVALFSAGAAAAAATGHLPDPVQRTVSRTFSHVGVDLPSPDDGTDIPTDPATTTTAAGASESTTTPANAAHEALGPDATGAAKAGLCTAYVANDGHGNSRDAIAFENLADAATKAGQTVAEFCAPTTGTTTTTTTGETAKPADPGNSGSTPAATAPGRPTEPGNSGSTPAATAPGQPTEPGNSGSTPAATAPAPPIEPGNSGSTPAATAPGASDAGNGHGRP